MGIYDRNWYFKGKHSPNCTCVRCTNNRIGKPNPKNKKIEMPLIEIDKIDRKEKIKEITKKIFTFGLAK